MYMTYRASLVRNFSVAIVNGSITLIILLIAPMGLAAVIMNTFLVTVASFFTATIADSVVHFLQPSRVENIQASVEEQINRPTIQHRDIKEIERQ
ncbi:CRISPR-associated protein Csx18 [Ancylothrix sp. C2]|uniref:CRISPR-associated protein Csx18 n=1 Tax=Ancylothrix sp. D3o TaxID=2953691 RepID=UPI0021BB8184|nr:CRISPR-associated protein Csx18 [Ancylothrix sp. D3o]MCT7953210.1 CRISPR-associated protein Csx18 [Ancylothrix sp. D3o]